MWLQTCGVTYLRAKMALISPIKPPPPPPMDALLLRVDSVLETGAGVGAGDADGPSSC